MRAFQILQQNLTTIGPYAVQPFDGPPQRPTANCRAFFGLVTIDGNTHVIKLANPHSPEHIAAVSREIAALRALRHDAIPRLLDAGTASFRFLTGHETPCPYLVIERAVSDLHVETCGGARDLPWRMIAHIALSVSSALEHIHREGWIHGDVKLDNLLLTASDDSLEVKIADFGNARESAEPPARRATEGTFNEYSPLDKVWTAAVDIYSLGVLLHNLTFREPFRALVFGSARCIRRDTSPPSAARAIARLRDSCTLPTRDARPDIQSVIGHLQELVAVPTKGRTRSASKYADVLWRLRFRGQLGPPEGPAWVSRRGLHSEPQGWKLHISLLPRDAVRLVPVLASICERHGVGVKVLANLRDYRTLNQGGYGPSLVGKPVTLYPRDPQSFLRVCDDLRSVAIGSSGPTPVTDYRVPDSAALFYRYGPFVHRADADLLDNYVVDPRSGDVLRDRRDGPWTPPWSDDPFGTRRDR